MVFTLRHPLDRRLVASLLAVVACVVLARWWPDAPAALMNAQALRPLHLATELSSSVLCLMVVWVGWYHEDPQGRGQGKILLPGFMLVAALEALHGLGYVYPPSAAPASLASLMTGDAARVVVAFTLLVFALRLPLGAHRGLWLVLAIVLSAQCLAYGLGSFSADAAHLVPASVAQGTLWAAWWAGGVLLFCAAWQWRRWRAQGEVLDRQMALVCLLLGIGELQRVGHTGALTSPDVLEHLLRLVGYAGLYLVL